MQKSSIIAHIKTLARGVNIITNSEISTILRSAAELIAFCRYHVLFDSTKPQTPNGRRYCHAYCHCTLHIFTKSSATISSGKILQSILGGYPPYFPSENFPHFRGTPSPMFIWNSSCEYQFPMWFQRSGTICIGKSNAMQFLSSCGSWELRYMQCICM